MRPKSSAAAPLAALLEIVGCATAPQAPDAAAAAVAVYQAPVDGTHGMPAGCREIGRTPQEQWTELDRVGPTDPYRAQRAATATAGGNVLLVLDHVAYPRNTFDCPAAAKITDCPPSLGAWYDLVFVSYACSAQGLANLASERRP